VTRSIRGKFQGDVDATLDRMGERGVRLMTAKAAAAVCSARTNLASRASA
jgi:hypothetical protein